MKKWFNYFVYVSIIFLIIALLKGNYLTVPIVYNYYYLAFSIIFVCLGFLFDAFSWYKILIHSGIKEVKYDKAIISMGLSIFGKYIPGKVWLIIGRSAYISNKYNYLERETSVISLNGQFISTWIGLMIGIIGLFFIGSKFYLVEISLFLWIILTILIFTELFHKIFMKLFEKIFKKTLRIPQLNLLAVLRVSPWFLLTWIFWCLGFHFLTYSLSSQPVSLYTGLSFAIAGTLGLIAVIPGGLGIREGILVTLLIMAGLDQKNAITLSVSSRLWFLLGETFIFIMAFILNRSELFHKDRKEFLNNKSHD